MVEFDDGGIAYALRVHDTHPVHISSRLLKPAFVSQPQIRGLQRTETLGKLV